MESTKGLNRSIVPQVVALLRQSEFVPQPAAQLHPVQGIPVEGQHSFYVSLGKAFHLGQFIVQSNGQAGNDSRAPAYYRGVTLRAGAIVSVQPFQCNTARSI